MEAFYLVRNWAGFLDEIMTKRITTMNRTMIICVELLLKLPADFFF